MKTSEIPGFPHYLITDDGRIWSERKQRYLRSATDPKGYVRQPLRAADGRPVCHYVHRTVATAFIPNPDNLPEVDHLDGNPSNNAVANLRWITHRDNLRAAIARRGPWLIHGQNVKPVVRIDPVTGARTRFRSVLAASESVNAAIVANGGIARKPSLFSGNISHVRGTQYQAYGYRWK